MAGVNWSHLVMSWWGFAQESALVLAATEDAVVHDWAPACFEANIRSQFFLSGIYKKQIIENINFKVSSSPCPRDAVLLGTPN